MRVGALFVAGLCGMSLCARGGSPGQTLYPIVDSTPAVRLPPAIPIKTTSTNTNQTAPAPAVSVELKPTAIGPTGARGLAEIKGRMVSLHLSRLGPGRYDLEVARRSDAGLETLGTLTIVDPTLGPSRLATDNKKEASANPESELIETDVQMKLPYNVRTSDIARVMVLGAGGNAVLTGDVKL